MTTNEEYFGSGTFQDFMNEEQEIKRAIKLLTKQLECDDEADIVRRMCATIVRLELRLEKVQTAQELLKL